MSVLPDRDPHAPHGRCECGAALFPMLDAAAKAAGCCRNWPRCVRHQQADAAKRDASTKRTDLDDKTLASGF